MKKIFIPLFLFLIFSSRGWAAIAYVSSSVFSGGASSVSALVTGALSVTAGNTLVITVAMNGTSETVSSISDTAGDTFAQATNAYGTEGGGSTDIWYVCNSNGNASNVVTVNVSSSASYQAASQLQYSGVKSTSCYNTAIYAGFTGTSVVTGSYTPSISNGLIVANMYANGGGTVATATGTGGTYNSRTNSWGTADLYPATNAAQTTTFSNTSSLNLNLSVAVFAPSTGTTTSLSVGKFNHLKAN